MEMYFGGVPQPECLQVLYKTYSVLPSISQNVVKVPGKPGEYDFGNEIHPRIISVGILIQGDGINSLDYFLQQVADWLYTEEAKQLIFTEDTSKFYMAKLTGDSKIDDIAEDGTGEITFYCSDPYIYGLEKSYDFAQSGETPVVVKNNGNCTAFPSMEMTFTKNVTDFTIADSNENALIFGKPLDLENDSEEDDTPEKLYDGFSSLSGWSTAAAVDNGVITGSFSSNGASISQTSGNYGSGSAWHGAAIEKSIGGEVQDFTASTIFTFNASSKAQMGRIEMYLLDVNGEKVCKVTLKDTSKTQCPIFEGYVGNGTKVVSTDGKKHSQFYQMSTGLMQIKRTGKKYEFYICRIDSKGKHTNAYTYVWNDTKSLYQSKIAKVRLHVGAWSTNAAINEMKIGSILVQENVTQTTNKVPYCFKTNDILSFDCMNGEIRKNGKVFYTNLNPVSKFLKLEKGVNSIIVSDPTAITNATISFNERWL